MIDQEAIRNQIRERLLQVDGIDPDQCAWSNVAFTPTPGTSWISEAFLVNLNSQQAVGTEQMVGFYDVTVVVPAGTGSKTAHELVGRIGNQFPPNITIGGPESVTIYRREPIPGRVDSPGWWATGLRLYWRSHKAVSEA